MKTKISLRPDRLEETDHPIKKGISLETLRRHGVSFAPRLEAPQSTRVNAGYA